MTFGIGHGRRELGDLTAQGVALALVRLGLLEGHGVRLALGLGAGRGAGCRRRFGCFSFDREQYTVESDELVMYRVSAEIRRRYQD